MTKALPSVVIAAENTETPIDESESRAFSKRVL